VQARDHVVLGQAEAEALRVVVDDLDLLELQADPALVAAREGRLELARGELLGGSARDVLDLLLGLLGRRGAPEEVVAGARESGSDGAVEQRVAALLGIGGGGLGGIAADLELLREKSVSLLVRLQFQLELLIIAARKKERNKTHPLERGGGPEGRPAGDKQAHCVDNGFEISRRDWGGCWPVNWRELRQANEGMRMVGFVNSRQSWRETGAFSRVAADTAPAVFDRSSGGSSAKSGWCTSFSSTKKCPLAALSVGSQL